MSFSAYNFFHPSLLHPLVLSIPWPTSHGLRSTFLSLLQFFFIILIIMVEKTHTHRKWLPLSLFPMHSHKKRHHSADKHALASSSAASSSTPTADPEIPWAKPPKKAPTLVRALFSKAKKHPHLRRAASLVEAHRHGRRRSSTLHSSRRSSADTPEDLPTRRWNIQRDYEVEIMQQKYDLIKLAFAG